MDSVLGAVGVQLLSDVILIGLVLAVLSVVTRFTWRRQLRRFLGVGPRQSGAIKILLSNIYVQRRGALGLNPVNQGFFGYALTEAEYFFALRLAIAFRTRTLGSLFQALTDRISESPSDQKIRAEVRGSPGYVRIVDDVEESQRPDRDIYSLLQEDHTLVLVGSPLYNASVDYVLTHAEDDARFEFYRPVDPGPFNIGYAIRVRPSGRDGGAAEFVREKVVPPRGPSYYREYCFVQKLHNPDWNARVFVCSGTSSAATTAALDKLASWRTLFREFGSRPFGVLYEVRTPDREVSVSDIPIRPEGWSVKRVLHYVEDSHAKPE